MANLIITVISIALVAVAALMGAYYGGQAFLDGQTNARANAVIEGAKQLAEAYHMQAIDNNSSYAIYSGDLESAPQTFVPKYMSAIPQFNWVGVFFGIRQYPYLQIFNFANDTYTPYSNGGNGIILRDVPDKIGQRVNTLANVTPTPGSAGNWGRG